MKTTISVSVILNIVLLVIILLLRECTPKCPECNEQPMPEVIVTENTDTVKLPGKIVEKPVPYYVSNGDHDTVFVTKKDSSQAINDYQLFRAYRLPVIDDTNGKIDVFANVQFNKIKDWHYTGSIYKQTTTIERNHYVKEIPRVKMFVGFQAGMAISDKNVILAPTIALLTKKYHLYSVAYDPFTQAATVSMWWKIRLSKK